MNDTNNTTNAKWYAKKYASYIDIMDNRCVFFARLYKKSTPDAETKARQIVSAFNQQERADNVFEALHKKLEDRNMQAHMLSLDLDTLKTQKSKLEKELADSKKLTPGKDRAVELQAELYATNALAHNLAEALRNFSNKYK